MPTANEAVNMALGRVGAGGVSDWATDKSAEGRAARLYLHEARKDLLALHYWNFATRRAQLTKLDTAPAFGWDNAFALPDDFLTVVSVHPSDDAYAIIPYKLEYIEDDSTPQYSLFSNSDTIYLRYIFDLTDFNVMSAGFRDCLSLRLARDFAIALKQDSDLAANIEQGFQRKLSRIKARDGIEDWPERRPMGSWAEARMGGVGSFVVNDG